MLSIFSFIFYFVIGQSEYLEPDQAESCACFFNVGQGHCFFFGKTDKSVAVLIDIGSSYGEYLENLHKKTNIFENKRDIQESIRIKLGKYIDQNTKMLIILTHGDKDHYNWLGEILAATFPPKRSREEEVGLINGLNPNNVLCILGGFPIDYCKARENAADPKILPLNIWRTKEFLEGIDPDDEEGFFVHGRQNADSGSSEEDIVSPCYKVVCAQKTLSTVSFKDRIQTAIDTHFNGNRVKVEILSADQTNGMRDKARLLHKTDVKNKNSIVTRLEYTTTSGQKVSFVIAGDAPGEITEQIIEAFKQTPEQLRSTILLASHHGANTDDANNKRWLKEAVRPCYIVNSHAMTAYGHPHEDVIARMRTLQLSPAPVHPLVFGTNTDGLNPIAVFRDYKYFLLGDVTVPIYSTCTQQHICFHIAADGTINPIFAAAFTPTGYIPIPQIMGGPPPPLPPTTAD